MGAVRVMIAANNRSIFETDELLTEHDSDAIAVRIMHVQCDPRAATYLEKTDTSTWVDGDGIAAHILALAEIRREAPAPAKLPRFVVAAPTNELTQTIATSSHAGGAVAHWLCEYLSDPDRLYAGRGPNDPAWLISVLGGELFASARAICAHWGAYPATHVPEDRASLRVIGRGLAAVSRERVTLRELDGSRGKVRRVDLDALVTWAEHAGFASASEIRAGVLRAKTSREKHGAVKEKTLAN
jgi:hypothetical protein